MSKFPRDFLESMGFEWDVPVEDKDASGKAVVRRESMGEKYQRLAKWVAEKHQDANSQVPKSQAQEIMDMLVFLADTAANSGRLPWQAVVMIKRLVLGYRGTL